MYLNQCTYGAKLNYHSFKGSTEITYDMKRNQTITHYFKQSYTKKHRIPSSKNAWHLFTTIELQHSMRKQCWPVRDSNFASSDIEWCSVGLNRAEQCCLSKSELLQNPNH